MGAVVSMCCGTKGGADEGNSVASLKKQQEEAERHRKEEEEQARLKKQKQDEEDRLRKEEEEEEEEERERLRKSDPNRAVEVGDEVNFNGQSVATPDGGTVPQGSQGKVIWIKEEGGEKLAGVQFPGFEAPNGFEGPDGLYTLDCNYYDLSLANKPRGDLAGGFAVGDEVWYIATPQEFGGGIKLDYRDKGKVTGASNLNDGSDDKKVAVSFASIPKGIAMEIVAITKEEPAEEFCGGWKVREVGYFKGGTMTVENDQKLEEGTELTVLAPLGDQVLVKLSGFKAFLPLNQDQVSKEK